MKLIRITTPDGPAIGILHDGGRVERVALAADPGVKVELLERMVNAFNALDGLSDKSLEFIERGESKAGKILERVVAYSRLFSHNNRMALKFLELAQADIKRLNDAKEPL